MAANTNKIKNHQDDQPTSLTDMDDVMMGTYNASSESHDEWSESNAAAKSDSANDEETADSHEMRETRNVVQNRRETDIDPNEDTDHQDASYIDEDEDKPVKKGMSKLLKALLWSVGILVVGAGGLFAYTVLTPAPPEPPQVVIQPQIKPIKNAQGTPVVTETAKPEPVPAPVEQPGGYDPAQDNASTASPNVASTPTPTPAGPVPTNVIPAVMATPAAASANSTAQVSPTPATAMRPAATAETATTIATPAVKTVTPLSAPSPALPVNASIATMVQENQAQNERLDKLESQLAKIDNQIAEMTELLKKMDNQPTNKVAIKEEPVYNEPVKVYKKPAAPRKPKVIAVEKVATEKVTHVASVKTAPDFSAPKTEDTAATKTLVNPALVAQVTDSAPAAAKPASRPYLVAIVPGRAFLQNSEGVRSDIAIGDHVPGCGAVNRIDPESAEVVTEKCVIK